MLRLHAFGGLRVERDGAPLAGAAAQPRRLALLALLLRAGPRGASREKVMATLWPDADEEKARRALAQALYALRRDLGDEGAIAGSKELTLDVSRLTSDVADFEGACARGDADAAIALHHAPFLDGFHLGGAAEFERWADRERAALLRRYQEALAQAAESAANCADWARVVDVRRRQVAADPLDARVALELMRALAATGDRAGALRHARVYEALVKEELDLGPDRDVVAFARELRATTHLAPAAASRAPMAVTAEMEAMASQALIGTAAPPRERPRYEPPPARVAAAPSSAAPRLVAVPHAEAPAASVAPILPALQRSARLARATRLVAGGAVLLVLAIAALVLVPRATTAPATALPTIALAAVGTADPTLAPTARAVTELLATALARDTALRVIPAGAGAPGVATERLEGMLYRLPDGALRLDLRRVSVADGTITHSATILGRDEFALADSAAASMRTGVR